MGVFLLPLNTERGVLLLSQWAHSRCGAALWQEASQGAYYRCTSWCLILPEDNKEMRAMKWWHFAQTFQGDRMNRGQVPESQCKNIRVLFIKFYSNMELWVPTTSLYIHHNVWNIPYWDFLSADWKRLPFPSTAASRPQVSGPPDYNIY